MITFAPEPEGLREVMETSLQELIKLINNPTPGFAAHYPKMQGAKSLPAVKMYSIYLHDMQIVPTGWRYIFVKDELPVATVMMTEEKTFGGIMHHAAGYFAALTCAEQDYNGEVSFLQMPSKYISALRVQGEYDIVIDIQDGLLEIFKFEDFMHYAKFKRG